VYLLNSEERFVIGNRISKITIVINVVLSAIKVFAGIIGRSGAMIADGIHSLSDVLSTLAVMLGLKLAKQPADEDHPYGHEKMEPVMAKILASILLITALLIGFNGIKSIINGTTVIPQKIAMYAAIISIIAKEWMYRYTVKGAKKNRSKYFSSTLTFTYGDYMFYKGKSSKSQNGIGLSICDEIIKLHNGTLDIESEVNNGTSVYVKLPI